MVYNWSVDLKKLKKNRNEYSIWKLEQMINFGLGGEKIDLNLLKKYWTKLKLDPLRRQFLQFLLWKKS
jgi:hypothetical protein